MKLKEYFGMLAAAFIGLMKKLEKLFGRTRFIMLLLVILLLNLLFIIDLIPEPKYERKDDSSSSAPDAAVTIESTPLPDNSVSDSSADESGSDHENALKPLKTQVVEALAGFPGEWSCYCKNLNTNDWFTINEHPVYPASMIKLFALAACYQKIEDGELDEDKYYSTIYNMAAISNNQAFNQMVWTIGKTYITEWCHSHGLPNTAQYHGLQPSTNYEGLETSDERNVTCVSDVGHILESIYRGECVSKYASEKMLDILMHQKWTSKIPFGLPNGTKFANKTGDTYDVTHDAAIVYSDGADYILVLMCEQENTSGQLKYCFIQTSKLVYQFFNGVPEE